MTPRSLRASVLLSLGLLGGMNRACKSDADSLGPSGIQAATGGVAGASPGPSAKPVVGVTGGAPTVAPERPRREPEAVGASVVTFLHGVVDAPRVGLCFAKSTAAGLSLLAEPSWPAGGLAFGESRRLEAPGGLDVTKDTLVTIVVSGDEPQLSAATCTEVLALLAGEAPTGQAGAPSTAPSQAQAGQAGWAGQAGSSAGGAAFGGSFGEGGQAGAGGEAGAPAGPSQLRARVLGALPPGTLAAGASYLFVATGCLGAPEFTDERQEFVCGYGYTPKTSTLTPLLVSLSRIAKFNAPGIQVLNASLGAQLMSLSVDPPPTSGKLRIPLVRDLFYGTLAPHPPYSSTLPPDYGTTTGATLNVNDTQLQTPWGPLLLGAGVPDLEAAKNYTFVLLGPDPSLPQGSWWNPSALKLLLNDPPLPTP